jgi:FtsP/CotA-like multicopper oxidase with cupredoxin domain
MPSSSGYKPVRPGSPHDDRASYEEHELEEKPQDGEEDVNPGDRLLPGPERLDDEWQDIPLSGIKMSRRSAWLLFLLGVLAMVCTGALVILVRMYIRNRAGDATVRTFRRPESDYALGLDWDYEAPAQVREYTWVIEELEANPDGVFRPMLVINGMFPGELIRCNEGDTIVVNVENRGVNATAVHFHGILQNGTNHMDGVPGVTQCPIAPGANFRYEFTVAGQTGTYFYHAHQATQALDGLVGPLVIHARDELETQEMQYASDHVVMIQDWYYDLSSGVLREKLSPGYEGAPAPDGALVNGLNKVDCSLLPERRCDSSSASFGSLNLAPNENHRLRIINVGALAWFELTIDEHRSLPVVEVDGTNILPATESSIIIAPGQRYSFILTTNQSSHDAYWFRARLMRHCFGEIVAPDEGFQEVTAVLHYGTPDVTPASLPTTTRNGNHAVECKDMNAVATYTPTPPVPAPASADHSYLLRVNIEIGAYRLERGKLNTTSYRPNLSSPTLHRVVSGLAASNPSYSVEGVNTLAFDPSTELVISHSDPQVIDLVLQSFDEGNHPFHLHGHTFFVLGAGHAYFPGYEALGLRPGGKGLLDPTNDKVIANPVRRDVATVEGFGWTLLRFVADNPGVWLFHCHLAWHSESGMAMQFVSRLDMMGNMTLPEANRRLCDAPETELRKGAAPEDSIWYDT